MNNFAGLFFLVFGCAAIVFSAQIGKLAVKSQNRTWGFKFGATEEESLRWGFTVVGLLFAVIGLLAARSREVVSLGLRPFQILLSVGFAFYILTVIGSLVYLYAHGYGDRVRVSMFFRPLLALVLWLGSLGYTRTWNKLVTLVGAANIVVFLLHPRFDSVGLPFLLSYILITIAAGILAAKMKDPVFEQTKP